MKLRHKWNKFQQYGLFLLMEDNHLTNEVGLCRLNRAKADMYIFSNGNTFVEYNSNEPADQTTGTLIFKKMGNMWDINDDHKVKEFDNE